MKPLRASKINIYQNLHMVVKSVFGSKVVMRE